MKAFAALVAVTVLLRGAVAFAQEVDVVVLTHGLEDDHGELAGLRVDVMRRLRERGETQLANAAHAFEARHSRAVQELYRPQLGQWWLELMKARERKNHERVAHLATQILRELADVPEADVESEDRKYPLAVCYDGLEAFKELQRLDEAGDLVEYCSGLAWLVTGNVKSTVRSILLRDVEPYRLTLRVAPADRLLWLQGSEVRPGAYDIRVRPGTRLAVTAACDGTRRVHWATPQAGVGHLAVSIDCEFDQAVHTDGTGRFWLSSPVELVLQHARSIAQMLGAASVVLVSKAHGHYELRRILANSEGGDVVSLPVVHTVADFDRAVDALQQQRQASAAGRSPAVEREMKVLPKPPAPPTKRGMLWSGVALSVAGLGAEAVGWGLYGKRARNASELVSDETEIETGEAESWHRARGPVLGLGISGGATAVLGIALLVSAVHPERVPWWVAAIAGGAGAGLATWGAVDIAKGQSCSVQRAAECNALELRQDRGVLLLASAAPLMSLLLAKGIGTALGRKEGGRVQASLGPAGARVWGMW